MDDQRLERLEALLRIDARIGELESARAEPKRPVWKNAALVAAYGSVIALVPALVTGVAGWLDNRRDFELARMKADSERTLAYVGLAVDPGATEAARAQVLRFLASLDDDPIGEWASAELSRVEGEIQQLEAQKVDVASEVETAAKKVETASSEAAQLQAQAREDPKIAKLAAAKTAQVKHLDEELQRKRDRFDALSTRTGDAPLEVLQMRAAKRIKPEPQSETTSVPNEVPMLRP
jgi:DNA repair exonuclease SbcCD ATPase subunit